MQHRGVPAGLPVGGGRRRREGAALLALMLTPIVAAYAIMARYAVNIPFIDDYPTVLGFCVKYQGLSSVGARMRYIVADQYTEYKLVLAHILSALELAATHHVSFSFLFWLGNLSLLPMGYVVWKSYFVGKSDLRRRVWLFLPMVFILFSVNYGEALDWTATALGYVGTIALSLGAIQLLVARGDGRRSWRWSAACICALAACLISANAFLLLPLGLFVLAPRRAYGWAAAWCGMFAAGLAPYFVDFVRETHPGSGPLLLIPAFFVAFLGAALQFVPLAILLGLAVLAIYAEALRRGFWRTHPAAMLAATWLLGSAAMAAVGRGRTGLAFSVVSRYRIYSDLLLIFCYGYVAERVLGWGPIRMKAKRRLYAGALVAAMVFCLHGEYQAVHILKSRRTLLLAGAAYYRADPRTHSPLHFGDQAADEVFAGLAAGAREDVEAAEREGLYRLPVEPVR